MSNAERWDHSGYRELQKEEKTISGNSNPVISNPKRQGINTMGGNNQGNMNNPNYNKKFYKGNNPMTMSEKNVMHNMPEFSVERKNQGKRYQNYGQRYTNEEWQNDQNRDQNKNPRSNQHQEGEYREFQKKGQKKKRRDDFYSNQGHNTANMQQGGGGGGFINPMFNQNQFNKNIPYQNQYMSNPSSMPFYNKNQFMNMQGMNVNPNMNSNMMNSQMNPHMRMKMNMMNPNQNTDISNLHIPDDEINKQQQSIMDNDSLRNKNIMKNMVETIKSNAQGKFGVMGNTNTLNFNNNIQTTNDQGNQPRSIESQSEDGGSLINTPTRSTGNNQFSQSNHTNQSSQSNQTPVKNIGYSPKTDQLLINNIIKMPNNMNFTSPIRQINENFMFQNFQNRGGVGVGQMTPNQIKTPNPHQMTPSPNQMTPNQLGNMNQPYFSMINKNINSNPNPNNKMRQQMSNPFTSQENRQNYGKKTMTPSNSSNNIPNINQMQSPYERRDNDSNGGSSNNLNMGNMSNVNSMNSQFYKNNQKQNMGNTSNLNFNQNFNSNPNFNPNIMGNMMNQPMSMQYPQNSNRKYQGGNNLNNNLMYKGKFVKSDKNLTVNLNSHNSFRGDLMMNVNNNNLKGNPQIPMPTSMPKAWQNNKPNNPNKISELTNIINNTIKDQKDSFGSIEEEIDTQVKCEKEYFSSDHSGSVYTMPEEDVKLEEGNQNLKVNSFKNSNINQNNVIENIPQAFQKHTIEPPSSPLLCVSIRLSGKDELIYISKREEIYETAKLFVQTHNLNQNLVLPIVESVKQALQSLEQILSHKMNDKDHNSMEEIQNLYRQKTSDTEDNLENEIIDTETDMSCLTDICSSGNLNLCGDSFSLSAEEAKKVERLNISR